jgi:SWI/SNF-related matrix-associated actin-dependent regulator of chromatin subfamily E protein 1
MSLPSNYKQVISMSNQNSQRLRASGGGSSDRMKDQNPFMHSSHSNPAFTPQKIVKSSVSIDSRVPKPPKPPEKPLLPYMRYSRKMWDFVKNTYPDLKLWEIGQKIGTMWKDLPEKEKQEFIDEYETEKVEYEKNLKIYHNSPAYLAYLSAKSKRTGTDNDTHDPPRSSSKSAQQDRRIDIQPAEDEDDQDEGYSFKHVAYSRYVRNHRLINEIFSEAVVPDVRSVVTTQRMHVLKRQVQSLAMHQMKLQAELQQIEEKFEAKKRKFLESSENFQEELKKHCRPAVDEETFQKMVERQCENLRRERARAMEEQTKSVAQTKPEENETPSAAAPVATPANPTSGNPNPEPMDIEPPSTVVADSDDTKSNDSTASQTKQLQEMAKSTIKEPISEPEAALNENANSSTDVNQGKPNTTGESDTNALSAPPSNNNVSTPSPVLENKSPELLQYPVSTASAVPPSPHVPPPNMPVNQPPVAATVPPAPAGNSAPNPPISAANNPHNPTVAPTGPHTQENSQTSPPNVTMAGMTQHSPHHMPPHQGGPAMHMPPHQQYGQYPPRPYYPPYGQYPYQHQNYPPYPPYHQNYGPNNPAPQRPLHYAGPENQSAAMENAHGYPHGAPGLIQPPPTHAQTTSSPNAPGSVSSSSSSHPGSGGEETSSEKNGSSMA